MEELMIEWDGGGVLTARVRIHQTPIFAGTDEEWMQIVRQSVQIALEFVFPPVHRSSSIELLVTQSLSSGSETREDLSPNMLVAICRSFVRLNDVLIYQWCGVDLKLCQLIWLFL